MKDYFSLSIRGRDWWLPILAYWFVAVAFDIPVVLTTGAGHGRNPGAAFVLFFVFIAALTVVVSLAYIAVLRTLFSQLSLGTHTFSFRGSMGRFLGINLLGVLLSLVTLGIYLPWWMRRALAHLVSGTRIDTTEPVFYGRGGTLFKYLLLCIYLPLIVLLGALVLYAVIAQRGGTQSSTVVTLFLWLFYLVFFVFYSVYLYLSYRWFLHIRLGDRTFALQTQFWEATGMVVGQLLLSIVTVSIYSPAAFARLYRYFIARTVVHGPEGEVGRFGFDAPVGRGFLIMWGQGLLSLITIGIYLPWAYARIARWFAQHTCYERVEQIAGGEVPGEALS